MGEFSGKCDFQDELDMSGVLDSKENFQNFKNKTKVYLGGWIDGGNLLTFETPEDLIPYYTHIVTSCVFNKEQGGIIHLSKKSWLEMEEEKYRPSPYRLRAMKRFDSFVREHGKAPLWSISLEEREKWTPCPLGEPYFCEPKLKNGEGSKAETKFCPYMYANRKMPCRLQKMREKRKSET